MKKPLIAFLLSFSILISPHYSFAYEDEAAIRTLNLPDIATVDDIAGLEAYSGLLTTVYVKDPIRGGLFDYYDIPYTADNGIYFSATSGKGSGVWRRQFNTETGVNILWYGADNTGGTDTSTIIENVMANYAAAVGAVKIYFPKGKYAITSEIGDASSSTPSNLITHDIELVGDDGASIFCKDSIIKYMIGFDVVESDVTIRNIDFYSDSLAETGLWFKQRNLESQTAACNLEIEDVKIFDLCIKDTNTTATILYGIRSLGKFKNVTIRNCVIDGMKSDGEDREIHGIWARGSDTLRLHENIVLEGNVIKNMQVISSTENPIMSGITIIGDTKHVLIENNKIENISYDTTGSPNCYGVDILNCDNTVVRNNSLQHIGTNILGNAYGMRIRTTDNLIVDKNKIEDVKALVSRGITINNNADAAGKYEGIVSNNLIKAIESPNDADGIHILQMSGNNYKDANMEIYANILDNCYKRGIKIQASGCNVFDNAITLTIEEEMNSAISSFGNDVRVSNNTFTAAVGSVAQVYTLRGSNTSLIDNTAIVPEVKEDMVAIGSSLQGTVIENILVSNNIFSSPKMATGISVEFKANNVMLFDNVFEGDINRMIIEVKDTIKNVSVINTIYKGEAPLYGDFINHVNGPGDSFVVIGNDVNVNSDLINILSPNKLQEYSNIINGTASGYSSKTGSHFLEAYDNFVELASGTSTFTLPSATGIKGKRYIVKNSGTGTLTLDTIGSETIDGTSSTVFTVQYSGAEVVSDGANWKIIGMF